MASESVVKESGDIFELFKILITMFWISTFNIVVMDLIKPYYDLLRKKNLQVDQDINNYNFINLVERRGRGVGHDHGPVGLQVSLQLWPPYKEKPPGSGP
jgi:hypothetical protein